MRKKRILKAIKFTGLIYISIYIIISGLYFVKFITTPILISSIYAGILTCINFIIALFLFEYSFKKSNKIFLIFNFGGLGLRLLFLMIAIFIIIKFLIIDKYAFILTFFLFYFIFLSIEIIYLHKNKTREINFN